MIGRSVKEKAIEGVTQMMKFLLAVSMIFTVSQAWAQDVYMIESVRCSNGNTLQDTDQVYASTALQKQSFTIMKTGDVTLLTRTTQETESKKTIETFKAARIANSIADSTIAVYNVFSDDTTEHFILETKADGTPLTLQARDRNERHCGQAANGLGLIVMSFTLSSTIP